MKQNIQKLKHDCIDQTQAAIIEKQIKEWEKIEDAIRQDLIDVRSKLDELDEHVTDVKSKVDLNAKQLGMTKEHVTEIETQVKILSITSQLYGERLQRVETKSENDSMNMLTNDLDHSKLLKCLSEKDSFAKQLQQSYNGEFNY